MPNKELELKPELRKDSPLMDTLFENSIWVYNSIVSSYATIHRAKCPFCNEGTGMDGRRNQLLAFWRGPFSSFDDAVQSVFANVRSLNELRYCRHCVSPFGTQPASA